jgi:hypothetical protein
MPVSESIAQLMFWFSLTCLPLSFILFVAAFTSKSNMKSKVYLIVSPFTALHFWWYFKTLGIGLADKTGNSDYPNWWIHMIIAVIISLLLLLLQKSFPNRSKQDDETQ